MPKRVPTTSRPGVPANRRTRPSAETSVVPGRSSSWRCKNAPVGAGGRADGAPAPWGIRTIGAVFDPRADLSPGRRVRIDGKPGSVHGLLDLEEEGDRWLEALVHLDEGLALWLSVEWMPTPVATVWLPVRPTEVDGGPGEKQVRLGGTSFAFYENGTASYRATGETGTEPAGRVDYVDYVA
ncbi:MAG TPA: hypothetical protein DCS55_02485, partial [Acidimicrobiaceae bacterium]|nr:hypothetical protein [Acidimicrobiaceae bacterium]